MTGAQYHKFSCHKSCMANSKFNHLFHLNFKNWISYQKRVHPKYLSRIYASPSFSLSNRTRSQKFHMPSFLLKTNFVYRNRSKQRSTFTVAMATLYYLQNAKLDIKQENSTFSYYAFDPKTRTYDETVNAKRLVQAPQLWRFSQHTKLRLHRGALTTGIAWNRSAEHRVNSYNNYGGASIIKTSQQWCGNIATDPV